MQGAATFWGSNRGKDHKVDERKKGDRFRRDGRHPAQGQQKRGQGGEGRRGVAFEKRRVFHRWIVRFPWDEGWRRKEPPQFTLLEKGEKQVDEVEKKDALSKEGRKKDR